MDYVYLYCLKHRNSLGSYSQHFYNVLYVFQDEESAENAFRSVVDEMPDRLDRFMIIKLPVQPKR